MQKFFLEIIDFIVSSCDLYPMNLFLVGIKTILISLKQVNIYVLFSNVL